MKIHLLMAHRNERYSGEYAPEVCVAWDEFLVAENYEGWREDVESYKTKYPVSNKQGEYGAYAEITIHVNMDHIMNHLRPSGIIEGVVEA